ncbi:HNH endonuclease signature motif containing protein [Mycolicibacterium frederiksbergense]|uniref:HNH endonuclease signature motif containing protein n=1 Tax=Mycolicibacterium frederiksbergense TaxID=117567 RepID=UPI00399BCEBB
MNSDVAGGGEAVQHARSDRAASVKALLDADFTMFDTAELLGLLSEREQQARADTAVDHRILAALMDRATAHEIGGKTWTDVLATRDRLSATEAGRRITAARDLGPRHTMTGEVLEPVLVACAAALAAGAITTGHIAIIRATLNKASARLDATARGQLEATLVDIAATNTPETLQKAADHALALLNPDGDGPDLAPHRRGLSISAQDVDGMAKVSGWVDAEFAAYLRTILEVWARPGINNPDDVQPQQNPVPNPLDDDPAEPDTEPEPEPEFDFESEFEVEVEGETEAEPGSAEPESEVEPETESEVPGPAEPPVKWDPDEFLRDPRTQSQRNHDAIKAVLRDTLASKRLGQHNGLPVSVVVSTTLKELEAAAGIAVTGAGTLMPMRDLIRLAEHAHHYLIVYRHHTAEPLYMGRSKRLATKAQRLLLYHRDRGCTRPGCTQAACRCQAHHANPSWNNGGLTDAPDLGLGCAPDNLLAELGWTNTIDPVTGRVHWHPPPLMNTGGDTLNHHFHPEELLPPELRPGLDDEDPIL